MTARPGPSPSVSILELDSFRPDLMEETVSGAALEHVQLARGRFRATLLSAFFDETRVDLGAYNLPVLAAGPMPADRVTLGFVLEARGVGLLNGTEIRHPVPVVLGEHAELHFSLAAGTRWIAFQVGRDALENLHVFPLSSGMWIPHSADAGTERLRRAIYRGIQTLAEIGHGNPEVSDANALATCLQEELLGLFCGILEPAIPSPPKRVQLRLVRIATDYLDAHSAEPIRIRTLCDITGASWKTLERAFVAVSGVTPKRYLTLRRLTRARQRLLAASPYEGSVRTIAKECGIFHEGRFSRAYRDHFNELPSATLASRAGPALRIRQY